MTSPLGAHIGGIIFYTGKISLVFMLFNDESTTSIQRLLIQIIWLVDTWNIEGTITVEKQCILVSAQ